MRAPVMSIREMVTAALFAALTAAGALVAIPVAPVPFTFQVLFVLMCGLMLRARAAAAAMVVYIAIGAIGLPVFAGGHGGLGVLIGPTGGYLAAFLPAAILVSIVAGFARPPVPSALTDRARPLMELRGSTEVRPPSYLPTVIRLAACLAGLAVVYVIGPLWLATVTGIGPAKAFEAGVLPFLPFDLIKAGLAVAAVGALDAVARPVPVKNESG